MTDEEKTQEQIWDEVGQQFEAMGEALTAAVNDANEDEENQQALESMQADFKATVARMNEKLKAAKESGESPDLDEEASELGALSEKWGEQAKAAGLDATEGVQPHLSAAFGSAQEGVSQLISSLQRNKDEQ